MKNIDAADRTYLAIQEAELAVTERLRSHLWSRPGFLIRRLHQIHDALFLEECSLEGITPVQHGILTVLLNRPWMDQSSISHELGLDRTNTADVVRRLEEKKLVKRQVNPNDKRSRQVYITPYGIELMKQLRPKMQRSQDRLIDPLTESEKKEFMRLMVKIAEVNNNYGRTILKTM